VVVIEFAGVGKRFPGVRALDGVSFTVERGACHALLGENGAGKSTLGKLLAGLYAPDVGSIHLDGKPLTDFTPAGAMRAGIALVHQELALCPNLTVAENLSLSRLPARGWGLDRAETRRRAVELLDRVGLRVDPDTLVERLSTGEEQLVQIAAAVGGGAAVLVFDEPTSSLGAAETARLFALIKQLRERGATIVYVSHRLDEVFALCDRVTILRDGRHVETRALAGLTHDDLIRRMVGRDVLATAPPPPLPEAAPSVLDVQDVIVDGASHGVSLRVRTGEVVGLAGLVGAGRTEFLEAVYGVRQVISGSMKLEGATYRAGSPRQACGDGVGLIPEDRKRAGLVLEDSVAENLTLPVLDRFRGRFGRLLRSSRDDYARAEIARYGIRAPGPGSRTAGLSGGNQQKIVFSKGIAVGRRLLLVDEPTRGVDVGAKQEIHELLRQHAAQGTGVLLASSELPELMALSHRIVVFRDRRIVAELDRDQFDEARILSAMAGGEPIAS
jgi:ABC-type sugar transport system ATPase subunit